MPPTLLVYFTGAWSEHERQAIERAARKTEQDQPFDLQIIKLGCSWVCSHVLLEDRDYYLAHWARKPGAIVKATSVLGLVYQMETTCTVSQREQP